MTNKKLILIIIVIAAASLFYWWWSSKSGTPVPLADELEGINQDLDQLNVNDLDKEFEQIDQDLNNL